MLVPLTRQKFEQLIPTIATGAQYKYYWGKFPDFLQRFSISVGIVLVILVLESLLQEYAQILLLIGIIGGLYWLWGPVFWASKRNLECRRYKYSGFWRGEVLDAFVTDEVVGKPEETTNKRGDLVIVENREKKLNLEVGDETGFSTQLQVPLRREYKALQPGDAAEMLVMSNRPDLSRISKVSDIFLPDVDLWVSDYPYLRRDEFAEIGRRIQQETEREKEPRRKKRSRKPTRRDDDY
jgi:hypothetical protein